MLLDEAESFFISHIRQGLRILLFLARPREYLEMPDSMSLDVDSLAVHP
jgi:hypothetical protein|eukprot:SAG25_NODE_2_length_31535_cov_18.197322_11_plen_49_part_00